MVDVAFGATVIASVFAVVNPLGAVPFFSALTDGMTPQQKRTVIARSASVALATLFVFAAFGRFIFAAFGFTIPAFQIAGGALLFVVGFQMLQGVRPGTKMTAGEQDEVLERESVGVVPLGIPLLAGPGAITTVMIYMSRPVADPLDQTFVFVGILIAIVATFLLLQSADRVMKQIGRTGTLAFGRVMGILLAAIAVQFIIDGVIGVATLQGLLP